MNFFLSLTLLFVLTAGCASFVDQPSKLKGDVSHTRKNQFVRNEKFIKISAVMISGNTRRESDNVSYYSSIDSQNEMVRELEKYIYLRLTSVSDKIKDGEKFEIKITDKILGNGFQKAWWAISLITIGVVPFWTKGTVESSFVFIDEHGRRTTKMYLHKYSYVQQILLLPFIFKSKKEAVTYIGKMQIDQFVDDLIKKK